MDDIIKKCEEKVTKMFVGYWRLQRVEISEGAFADDIVLIADNETKLQENLIIWNNIFKEEGMKINLTKTKTMMIGDQQINIDIEGTNIEQVEEYNYLGIVIDQNGKQDKEINKRIEKTNKLYYAMNNKFIRKREVSKQTKIKIFKTVYRSVLTYGCESWTLTNKQRSKIQAAEMKFLRGVQGVTRRDRIRNTEIRREVGVQPITEYIEQRQLSWWGHLQRMDDNRQVKKVYQARIQGKQKRGRPQQTWSGEIGRILQKKGLSWNEAGRITANRRRWRKIVYEG